MNRETGPRPDGQIESPRDTAMDDKWQAVLRRLRFTEDVFREHQNRDRILAEYTISGCVLFARRRYNGRNLLAPEESGIPMNSPVFEIEILPLRRMITKYPKLFIRTVEWSLKGMASRWQALLRDPETKPLYEGINYVTGITYERMARVAKQWGFSICQVPHDSVRYNDYEEVYTDTLSRFIGRKSIIKRITGRIPGRKKAPTKPMGEVFEVYMPKDEFMRQWGPGTAL